jgi:hypothetical protein
MRKSSLLRAEPLSPREVKAARLAPWQVQERWGYSANAEIAGLPEQVRSEFAAANAAIRESEARGTLREDYPQLYRVPGPADDLVEFEGLVLHDWQL